MQKLIIVLIASFVSSIYAAQWSTNDLSQSNQQKKTALVTGANRGIGLEYATQLKQQGYHVIATARKPERANELNKLGVEVLQLDVTDEKSVKALKTSLGDRPIDLLINNAGYFSRDDTTLDKVDFSTLEKTFAINSLGPLRVTQALIGNILASNEKKVVSMSSVMGSIETSSGRYYAYRTSKTALNQFNKILSQEFKPQGVIFTVVHPGWVRTDMGGSGATYTPQQSVENLLVVINGLTIENSGKFYDLNGKRLPW
ncbi:MAG: SDR family oxidoreductase [Kangiellaceae bacterium]|jgi:NAD(P)-dependent dehydrogenase (short-subunit alcohol dehydrogenase family)|nr:SDR family oxidoreductase [Kangiellaceae bacterium]